MIELGSLRFESQQKAKEFIQKFLRARGVCTILPEDDMFYFLADLIARHPEHGQKEPQGFLISRNALKIWNTFCSRVEERRACSVS